GHNVHVEIVHEGFLKSEIFCKMTKHLTLVRGRFLVAEFFNTIGQQLPFPERTKPADAGDLISDYRPELAVPGELTNDWNAAKIAIPGLPLHLSNRQIIILHC
ncbi:MAG: hypothetical protein WBQ78_02205, partial [Gammaproteobacteria bacterium]